MPKCTRGQGFTEVNLLQYGLDSLEAAKKLFLTNKRPEFIDPAGYLAQLGIELILKAWHLYLFNEFEREHKLNKLYLELTKYDSKLTLDDTHQEYLKRVAKFYHLRYPRPNDPIPLGHEDWEKIKDLTLAIARKMPIALCEKIKEIIPTEKGGKRLLQKIIE